MKLPNRYGSVSKLSGNRSRPFVVREGVSGKQKAIGYARSQKEGLGMLADYHKRQGTFVSSTMTFEELYGLWLEKRAPKLGVSNQHSLNASFKHCDFVKKMKYSDVKAFHMQECIDTCGCGYATQSSIKNLFAHLDKLALELDIIDKKFSDSLTTDSVPDTNRTTFTDEERSEIWNNSQLKWVDTILIFLYTGFRFSELLTLKKSQVDLEKRIITGGMKTKAGKNRVIPIHSKIFSFIEKRMETEGEYLISIDNNPCTESQYRTIWKKIMKELKMNHTPHECRHTLRSLLDSAGANAVCIDRIMGHKSIGTGERIYTHKNIEELRANLELVTN